jgi:NAD(P)-dependent dehydrogenase (short-subunit alcohol dehydrogenase family)
MRAVLSNTTIVVTGASSGIGRALALQLVADGATVVATARTADKLETLAAEAGKGLIPVATDVSDLASVQHLAESTLARCDAVDAVVNNAGIGFLEPFLASTPEHWRETIETNLFGALRTMQAFLPGMVQRRRGLILNVGSSGSSGWPYLTLYAASKAALEAATVSIDREYADTGIRAVSLDVGPTRGTQFGSRFTDPEVLGQATDAWTRLGIPWSQFVTTNTTARRIMDTLAEHLKGDDRAR